RSKKTLSRPDAQRIEQLWKQGVEPMRIASRLNLTPSVVYRIGIELGLWHRNPHGRRAHATSRRCEYLTLRVRAMG
ncbi:hypothetical protein QVA66_11815, partial [Staphylococcus chromogenes]|nr:hypothetical protein [Staphylococcus chromogenes]